MADKVYSFRNSRTGAIRRSTTVLGYPFVPVKAAELRALDAAADELTAEPAKAAKPRRQRKAKG